MKNLVIATLFLALLACNQEQRNKHRGAPLSAVDSIEQMKDAQGVGMSEQDQNFVQSVALAGLVEIASGKLAEEKSKDMEIQNFGSLLVSHHQQLSKDLKELISQRNVAFPDTLDSVHQQKLDSLNAIAPTNFDRAFLELMVKDHETVVALFDQTAAQGSDVQLKAFANKNVPIIRNHLRIANELMNKTSK